MTMRKPITAKEACLAIHDGKTVWRGNRAYDAKPASFMAPVDVRYVTRFTPEESKEKYHGFTTGQVGAIEWWLFLNMEGFEVEVDDIL
jgi:hypothetical protein